MNESSNESEKIISEILVDAAIKNSEIRSESRKQLLSTLSSMMDHAYRKGTRQGANARLQQRWFTIVGYLAQVSTRLVRDLEYEQLRSELDELKKRVLPDNVNRLRRAIYAANHGKNGESANKSKTLRGSN